MITFSHIRKIYEEKTVFDDFSLTLPEKGIVCFSAPSGYGKTTLFRLLLGLEKPDGGEITGAESLRFSCVFQEPRLVPGLDALGNVLLVAEGRMPGCEEEKQRALKLLTELGLSSELHNLPSELSGGEKARVSLARALFASFDVLILDEPFAGIDAARKEQIYPLLEEAAKDCLILMTTHQQEDAEKLHAAVINLSQN